MATQSHTPGPWVVENTMGPDGLWIVQGGKPKHEWWPIAVCNMPYEDDHLFTGADVHANARVLAAGPELLAAAKLAVDCAQALNQEMTDAYAALSAAIAKAEGRA